MGESGPNDAGFVISPLDTNVRGEPGTQIDGWGRMNKYMGGRPAVAPPERLPVMVEAEGWCTLSCGLV